MPAKRPGYIVKHWPVSGRASGFTLVCTFSRDVYVHNFFAALNNMRIPVKQCHLLIIDNTDIGVLAEHLKERAKVYVGAFKSVRLYKTYRRVGGDVITEVDTGFKRSKLPMIYAMHHDMLKLVNTDKFVLLEDDTIAPPNAVVKLLRLLEQNPRCGIATAIETGRSDIEWQKTRLGVHYVEREGNRMLARYSPSPHLRGVHSVDCCGWYCCASYHSVWMLGFEGMDKYLEDIPRFALDGMHTNNIKQAGWDILADFSLWCGHMQAAQGRIIFWGKKQAVPHLDVWLTRFRDYAQGVLLVKPWHKRMLRSLERQRDRTWKRGATSSR
jgi:hypothetical protein